MHVDYMIMKSGEEGQELTEKGKGIDHDEGNPIIVYRVRDGEEDCKVIGAHVVTPKGADHWAAERLATDIKNMGYGRMIWKSDQEPAIVALRDLVRTYLGIAVTLEDG